MYNQSPSKNEDEEEKDASMDVENPLI